MRLRKIISSFIVICMITSLCSFMNVYAEEDSATISVTVPLSLPITQLSDGSVVEANNASIINNSDTDVYVSNISVNAQNGWSILDYETEFSSVEADSSQFALALNQDTVNTDGTVRLSSDWSITSNSNKNLEYDSKVSKVNGYVSTVIAKIVFTVDVNQTPPIPPLPPESTTEYDVPVINLTGEDASSLWVWTTDASNHATITNYLGTMDSTVDLVVPTSLDGATVTTINSGSNFQSKTLKSLGIPNGITVNSSTFKTLTADTVKIAGENTIGASAFENAVINNLLVRDTEVGNKAFFNSTIGTVKLSGNITIPASCQLPLFSCGNNLSCRSSITSLIIDTPTIYDESFYCANIGSVTFTENANSVGSSAFNNTYIGSITGLSNLKTIGDYAFSTPQKLTAITDDISFIDTSIGNRAFYSTSASFYYTFNDISFTNCTLGERAFYYLKANDVSITDTEVGNKAFLYGKISNIDISGELIIPDDASNIFSSSASSSAKITSATIDVATIPNSFFRYCGITDLYLGDLVDTVSTYAFYNCASDITVSIPSTCTYQTNSFPSGASIVVREPMLMSLSLEATEEVLGIEETIDDTVKEETSTEENLEDKAIEEDTKEVIPEDITVPDKVTEETDTSKNTQNDVIVPDTSSENTVVDASESLENAENTSVSDNTSENNTSSNDVNDSLDTETDTIENQETDPTNITEDVAENGSTPVSAGSSSDETISDSTSNEVDKNTLPFNDTSNENVSSTTQEDTSENNNDSSSNSSDTSAVVETIASVTKETIEVVEREAITSLKDASIAETPASVDVSTVVATEKREDAIDSVKESFNAVTSGENN